MKVGKLQFETVSSHSEKLENRHMFHLRKSVCVCVCVKMVTGSAAKHPCNVKEVQDARNTVHWPRINKDIENMIRRCKTCQTYRNKQT